MVDSEEESLHYKIVYRILPEFAKKLKEEGARGDVHAVRLNLNSRFLK